ncbi:MAG: hypothetical protein P4L84_28850 [Isosphaeraceae bacterium]|nr:hypothetical protein [Isosphaeraceae bacterium]
MSNWCRVELDGLLAVVVGVAGDPDVPEEHVAVWFGDPRYVRKSQDGPGGQQPEVWTVPAEYLVSAAEPIWRH